MLELTETVLYLHQRGLIHRDIKPENVFLINGKAGSPGFVVIRVKVDRESVLVAGRQFIDFSIQDELTFIFKGSKLSSITIDTNMALI